MHYRPKFNHKTLEKEAPSFSRAPIAVQLAELLAMKTRRIVDVSSHGPRMAIKQADFPKSASARREWFARARITAVLGSCPRSQDSFRSGLRCYMKFAEKSFGCVEHGFPPTIDGILAWSCFFKCVGTFSNYVGYLRCACCAINVQCPEAGDSAIQRAKVTILKRMINSPRPRMFIQRPLVRRLIATASESPDAMRFAMLWLAAYVFLLRVPSEALSMKRGGGDFTATPDEQAVLWLNECTGELCLRLHRRKNREQGSLLQRVCSCKGSPDICPIHILWDKFFKQLSPGCAPWKSHISAPQARSRLRDSLRALQVVSMLSQRSCCLRQRICQVPNAAMYGTHDFRRGHAKDLQDSGAPLAVILAAGEWKGRAVVSYMDLSELERDVALEASMLSDGEGDA